MDQASSIPAQTQVTDLYPKLSELDLLLGVQRSYAPWAYFYPPKSFNLRRKSPFSFSRVLPSITSEDEEEDRALLENIETTTKKKKKEKKILQKCMKQLHTINEWLGHIIGRIGQLLQG
ncbi:MAG: DUF5399 family protein [Chlamydiia bacterium]|nr:DUF5399 family protein [Chlamydiia bacterium]